MSVASPFASVKLTQELVHRARQAAQPMRRSVASQIEYWATLGQVVEHTGLSVQEARTAIEDYERKIRDARAQPMIDALEARFLAADADASLIARVRAVVAENRAMADQGSTLAQQTA